MILLVKKDNKKSLRSDDYLHCIEIDRKFDLHSREDIVNVLVDKYRDDLKTNAIFIANSDVFVRKDIKDISLIHPKDILNCDEEFSKD